jgi:hypothetical protein
MIAAAAQLLLGSMWLHSSEEVRHFPGSYFDSSGRVQLQARAMQSWPGPSALAESWRSGKLETPQRMAILLGAPVHHDPSLLPLYREAIQSPTLQLRQAAAYGYHDLIGDRLPDVSSGVGDRAARRLAAEMDLVADTLRRHPLVALWLQAALQNEGRSLPWFTGAAPQRPAPDCLKSVDALMTFDDLDLLVQAYQLSERRPTRIALMRLIEGVTLSRFVPRSVGATKAWGPEVYNQGMRELDAAIARWQSGGCTVDATRVLVENFALMGVELDDPRAAGACAFWQNVLRAGDSGWWAMAARQLYDCGGPWRELSVLQPESELMRERRQELLRFFRLDPIDLMRSAPKPRP